MWEPECMIDLEEDIIRKILRYCLASKETPPDRYTRVQMLSPNCKVDAPSLPLRWDRLEEMKEAIAYLLGQLWVVHRKQQQFSFGQGFVKYNETKWTEEKGALFSLYYLAVAAGYLLPFEPSAENERVFVARFSSESKLQKTVSPNDPAFQEFCEECEYREMLPRLIEARKIYYASAEYKRQVDENCELAKKTFGAKFAEEVRDAYERLEFFETKGRSIYRMSKKEAAEIRRDMKKENPLIRVYEKLGISTEQFLKDDFLEQKL